MSTIVPPQPETQAERLRRTAHEMRKYADIEEYLGHIYDRDRDVWHALADWLEYVADERRPARNHVARSAAICKAWEGGQ